MSIFDEIGQSIGRKHTPPAQEPEKWLDGTPKDQPRVRDHNGNQFDRARFLEDPEYRMKNREAYVRMRHLEDEQRTERENAEANARARQERQERQDSRIRAVAEEQVRAEERVEAAEEHAQKVAERVEQLRPLHTPQVDR